MKGYGGYLKREEVSGGIVDSFKFRLELFGGQNRECGRVRSSRMSVKKEEKIKFVKTNEKEAFEPIF